MVSRNTEDRDNETPDLDYLGGIYDGRGRVPYCIGKSQSNDAADFGDCVEASGGGRERAKAIEIWESVEVEGLAYIDRRGGGAVFIRSRVRSYDLVS